LTIHNQIVIVFLVPRNSANPVFRALADPTRRAIFEQISRHGEQTVHALTRHSGVSQPAVSKHLTVLKRAKLVKHRREGRETHYRTQPSALKPIADWLNLYGAFWNDRFDKLESLLQRMDQ
jgi:DNA-binding transcriptional ArsR family regulator